MPIERFDSAIERGAWTAMVTSHPHFLLFSEAEVTDTNFGRWRFQLESADGAQCLEASDEETDVEQERLELLAVVRGLEALDQPSRVTLVTNSRRISLGFRHGLDEWRQNDWRWERDGRWLPIKNCDLWQRVDRALKFHRVRCRTWRFETGESAAQSLSGPHFATRQVRPAVTPATVERRPSVGAPVRTARWRQLGHRLATAAQILLVGASHGPGVSESQVTT